MKETIKHFIQGGLIGIGNIIPGVSGATVALILGIYKRLIGVIDSLNVTAVLSLLKSLSSWSKFKEEMSKIQGWFLATVLCGVLVFVYAFSFAISYCLKNFHDATYSLFFGLILASIVIPFRYITKKTWYGWLAAAIAATFVVCLSFGLSAEEQAQAHQKKIMIKQGVAQQKLDVDYTELGYYFMAGAIAISAMILPGVSGSFILLLMGSYFDVLLAIKQLDLWIIGFFGCGCLVGLIGFTKVMKYLLEKYESTLMFFLSGLILGSLYSIWPFKKALVVDNMTFYGENILPSASWTHLLICGGMCCVGVMLVVVFERYDVEK
ncbi:DUF368 domain-containing protein [Candidatus Uabimicrobium amorphum]|uniref:DUF368 domain-containing protein n=1 Tax=Uabimicrobium amorphum TaxID=2596890 RepID=A0A5S9IU33_UABAM|nr:DUF368 domain-containing protein [Candidatus Uabimicrobium amorphum]BBM88163.1 DUF368 domain-containing protein [Candidatus Uabimicrobium amorphum]